MQIGAMPLARDFIIFEDISESTNQKPPTMLQRMIGQEDPGVPQASTTQANMFTSPSS